MSGRGCSHLNAIESIKQPQRREWGMREDRLVLGSRHGASATGKISQPLSARRSLGEGG